MNSDTKAFNSSRLIIFGLTLVIGLSLYTWWEYTQSQQQKLTLERQRIGKALRQAGIAAAKIQLSLPQTASHEDNLAPHELTDEGELAQAKLWQTLPKDKRAIMQTETNKAGLAAASNK